MEANPPYHGKQGNKPTNTDQKGRPTNHREAYQPSKGYSEANQPSKGTQGGPVHLKYFFYHVQDMSQNLDNGLAPYVLSDTKFSFSQYQKRPDMTLAMNPGKGITEYISCRVIHSALAHTDL